MYARSSSIGLRLIWRPLGFSSNKCVIFMIINFSWNFRQKVFTLSISFIVLNASIEFVLIYRPHPVWMSFFDSGLFFNSFDSE
jgi:hypothetical protein